MSIKAIRLVARVSPIVFLCFMASVLSTNPVPTLSAKLSSGDTKLISVPINGGQANGASGWPSISADGRFVVFRSMASNLVSGDDLGWDIFVRDLQTGKSEIVSVNSAGEKKYGWPEPETAISADGRYIAFLSENQYDPPYINIPSQIYIRDRPNRTTELVSGKPDGKVGNGWAGNPSVAVDGTVAFSSTSSDLVVGDTNGVRDVFIRNVQSHATMRISVSYDNQQVNRQSDYPSITPDGKFLAFASLADNIVQGDTNGAWDIIVVSRETGEKERLDLNSNSSDTASPFGGIRISADGRIVAFHTFLSLVGGDTNGVSDVFVYDRDTDHIRRVSVATSGIQGNESSFFPSISSNGSVVAFVSDATNLVGNDTNGASDVFIHDIPTGRTERVSVSFEEKEGNAASALFTWPGISGDGRFVVFDSSATNLIEGGDTNGWTDVFARDSCPDGSCLEPTSTPSPIPPNQVDITIDSVLPLQVLEGQDLVKGKLTALKVVIHKSGSGSLNNVSVKASTGSFTTSKFFVADSANLDARHTLRDDNSRYDLDFLSSENTKTIYFIDSGFTPYSGTFQAVVEVDPLNMIPETKEENNSRTIEPPVAVHETHWGSNLSPELSVHYFIADRGSLPKWYFNEFYNYSNHFLGAVYPVAESNFIPSNDINSTYDSTYYRGVDNMFTDPELRVWAARLAIEMNIAHPSIARFVAAFVIDSDIVT